MRENKGATADPRKKIGPPPKGCQAEQIVVPRETQAQAVAAILLGLTQSMPLGPSDGDDFVDNKPEPAEAEVRGLGKLQF